VSRHSLHASRGGPMRADRGRQGRRETLASGPRRRRRRLDPLLLDSAVSLVSMPRFRCEAEIH